MSLQKLTKRNNYSSALASSSENVVRTTKFKSYRSMTSWLENQKCILTKETLDEAASVF